MLLTVLGEYVLPRSDGVWQETLVTALGALAHKPHAARQAVARSVAGGWLRAQRHGRRSRMFLTDESAEMLRTGAERIYTFGEAWEWSGEGVLVVVGGPGGGRAGRHQGRTRPAGAGVGSVGGGRGVR